MKNPRSFTTLFAKRTLLGPLIKSGDLLRVTSAVLVLQVALVRLGLPGWPCPFRHGLGFPSPGCGLSRSLGELASGNWQQALEIHAFAPVAAAIAALMVGASFLPRAHRRSLGRRIERFEQRTWASMLLAGTFLIYWLLRAIFFPDQLHDLMH